MGISSSDGNTVTCCGIDQCGAIEQEKVYQDTAKKCEWRSYSYLDCKEVMGSCDTTGSDKKMCGYRYACVQSVPTSGWSCSGGNYGSSNGSSNTHCTTYCGGTTGCHTNCH